MYTHATDRTLPSPRRTMSTSTRSSSTNAAADGRLAATAAHATGGRGNGVPHLPSQSSIVISPDARFVLVANAGSGDVSTFAITADGIDLAGRTAVGGAPTSIAIHRDLVYVLTTGDDTGVRGFRLAADGRARGARRRTDSSSARRMPTRRRSRSARTAQHSSSASAAPTA